MLLLLRGKQIGNQSIQKGSAVKLATLINPCSALLGWIADRPDELASQRTRKAAACSDVCSARRQKEPFSLLEKRHGPLACPSLSRASLSQSSGRPYSSSRATANPYPNRPRFRFICLSNTSTPCFLLSAFTVTPFPFPSFRAGTSTYYHSTTAGPRVKSWKCSAIIPVRQSRLVIHACVHCSVSQASAGLKKDAWPARPGRSFRMLTCFQVERSPVGDFGSAVRCYCYACTTPGSASRGASFPIHSEPSAVGARHAQAQGPLSLCLAMASNVTMSSPCHGRRVRTCSGSSE